MFFDKRDRDLLKIVNGVLTRSTPDTIGKKGLFPWFHPHGIKELAETLSEEEKRILVGCQSILKREREISQMFIDGVVGMNFSKGLSFYLQCAPGYLKSMDRLFKPSAAAYPRNS